MAVWLGSVTLALVASGAAGAGAGDAYTAALRAIAQSIEALKPRYPQLAEFSAAAHGDAARLAITYGYRTETAPRTGGWTSGVPSPAPEGVWLYLAFHDADSTAQIHTQPVVPRYRFRDKQVMLLLREGAQTATLAGELARILRDNGVEPDGRGAVEATLIALANRWDQAIVSKDRAAIEANMADDFRHIDRSGNVSGRAAFLEGVLSPELQIDPYTAEDLDLRLYGDVALLSGRTRMTGRHRGQAFASHYRFVDVYVLRDGRWKVVNVQISPIPDPAAGR